MTQHYDFEIFMPHSNPFCLGPIDQSLTVSNGFNRTYSNSNDIRVLDKTILLQSITSRLIYTLLTKPLTEKPAAQKSISELLGTSDINWKVVYQLPHRVINETSLRVFQYKILNNSSI